MLENVIACNIGLMRAQATALLTDSCDVYSPTIGVSDGMGGYTAGSTPNEPEFTTYPCRLQHVSSLPESERESALRSQSDFYLVLPWNTEVHSNQYAIIKGTRYDFRDSSSPRTDLLTVRVPAKRIGPSQ